MDDEESDRRKPSPNVPGEAGYKFGLELHIGQQFARASELRAQIIRFHRSPDVMGKAWCMCDPLCNTPWQNLCSYPINEVFPDPQRAHHMFSRFWIYEFTIFSRNFLWCFFVKINSWHYFCLFWYQSKTSNSYIEKENSRIKIGRFVD